MIPTTGKCAKRDIASGANHPFPPQGWGGGLDSTLGAEQLHVHSQTQSQGNTPSDKKNSPATTPTSDIPINNVFTKVVLILLDLE